MAGGAHSRLEGREKHNSKNGGSVLAVIDKASKADVAYKFIEYASRDLGAIKLRVGAGAFPADNKTLADENFLNSISKAYYGETSFRGGKRLVCQGSGLPSAMTPFCRRKGRRASEMDGLLLPDWRSSGRQAMRWCPYAISASSVA